MAMEDSIPNISNPETNQQPQNTPSPEKLIGNHGLTKRILRRGTTWQTPFPGDEVEVHYSGHVEDGSSLGSSLEKGAPFKFKLGQREVIEGLDEGVATMKKGERAIFKVPPQLAYGEAGFPPLIPPHSTLIFDVEMISWSTIRDVTGDGGVLKKIITEGEDWATPKDGDEVSVKYEAELENGTKLSSSESVEFHIGDGKLCPAIHKAVKTMRRKEKAELSVRFSYGFEEQHGSVEAITSDSSCSNNLTIFLELLSWRSVVDIVGDKKIFKKVISAGEGLSYPNEGSLIKVIYVGKQEDGAIFERKGSNEEPFEYMCLEGQVNENLDKAIMTMKKGEKAQIFVSSDDMQGDHEVSETKISSSRLLYEVQLLDFTKEKPVWKMETQEKIEACEKKKEEGNALFKAGKFWLASKKYEKAVKCIEFNHSFSDEEKRKANGLLLSSNLNNAACKLKLEDFVGAATLCSKALELDPDNIKALFRRSQAYLQTSDLDKAEADSRRALTIDPNNRDIKLILQVIKTKQKEHSLYQAQLFGTMISKMV
ncbi:peptidyl-prolyl cis-trans isomerase FKBP65 isoform X2 [Beta vulgaris subsp. vulgaris]|uniref:peptidyl-prolyl cis-trans isomerase FKBP65 isoform X2 n=1 Tax=Beta vulgaris subsp. vulgaris TaxID=3555 RepID=UPI00053FF195|nr:peptidyl-prolyl cis-trans isomerase FKBP65 isoform X2 [Beta vulgaris subsp. vulgaris]